jgi:putative transposase
MGRIARFRAFINKPGERSESNWDLSTSGGKATWAVTVGACLFLVWMLASGRIDISQIPTPLWVMIAVLAFVFAAGLALTHPFHDRTATVTHCGRICFNRRKINLSQVFAGQNVGVTQVGERIWLVTFMDYDLGYFDDETWRLEPIENPFGPKVLPMSPE